MAIWTVENRADLLKYVAELLKSGEDSATIASHIANARINCAPELNPEINYLGRLYGEYMRNGETSTAASYKLGSRLQPYDKPDPTMEMWRWIAAEGGIDN